MASQNPTAAEVAESLGGLSFPADREMLVAHARENEASDRVMVFLERIPDKQYKQATELEHELSQYAQSNMGDDMREAA